MFLCFSQIMTLRQQFTTCYKIINYYTKENNTNIMVGFIRVAFTKPVLCRIETKHIKFTQIKLSMEIL